MSYFRFFGSAAVIAAVIPFFNAIAQTNAPLLPPPVDVVERGQDFAVYRSVRQVTGEDGLPALQTNQFTLLENGLHYFENGQWKESEDVIESFPNGAIARRGPNKAIFSHELNIDAVFDIQASDGKRLRGGIRAIQLFDVSTGKSLLLGTVKQSVTGQILPPNQILYSDAFDGVRADVLLVWKHNYFAHDVVFKSQPALPADWNPATTRLEVVTEFSIDFEPALDTQRVSVGPIVPVRR